MTTRDKRVPKPKTMSDGTQAIVPGTPQSQASFQSALSSPDAFPMQSVQFYIPHDDHTPRAPAAAHTRSRTHSRTRAQSHSRHASSDDDGEHFDFAEADAEAGFDDEDVEFVNPEEANPPQARGRSHASRTTAPRQVVLNSPERPMPAQRQKAGSRTRAASNNSSPGPASRGNSNPGSRGNSNPSSRTSSQVRPPAQPARSTSRNTPNPVPAPVPGAPSQVPRSSGQPAPRSSGQPAPRSSGQPAPRSSGQPAPRSSGQPAPRSSQPTTRPPPQATTRPAGQAAAPSQPPRSRPGSRSRPAAVPAAAAAPTAPAAAAVPIPVVPQQVVTKTKPTNPKRGEDVNVFFFRDKTRVEASYCLLCDAHVEQTGGDLPYTWTYGPTTGITNLRMHIQKYHKEEYLETCAKNNWNSLLPHRARDEIALVPPEFTWGGFINHLIAFFILNDEQQGFSPLLRVSSPRSRQDGYT
ncbi:hypothetical protein BDN72DRAFT_904995 [Pluteus cervinus]|uniref:Uncharacterized protein n=1 Tax=Pluteus cervinus TaxID=181527 RepID=A0ACD3A429_9AGAR|nr:hypothetical protein BDN72DRAFT_904995 [Pluteus cervinus]